MGDPVTADFTYIRWLGDRKGIEAQTKVWNKTILDRSKDLQDWVALLPKLQSRVVGIFAFANNHYGGFAPDTIRTFLRLWGRGQPPRWTNGGPAPGTNREFSF